MAARRAPRRPRTPVIHLVAMQIAPRCARARWRCLRTASRRRRRNRSRARSRYGYARADQREERRLRSTRRTAQAATICCARISSGASRNLEPVQLARADGAHQRGAFDQFVARGGEEYALSAARRPSARSGRCAAAPPRSSAASRSGRPGRPCRCRCPVRATRSPPPRAARRSSAALRPPGAAAATGCRDAAAPRPRPAARPDDAPRARTSRRVLTKTSVVRCAQDQLRQRDRRSRPTSRCWRRRRVRRAAPRPPDPSRGDGRH